jgi:hypothetical protein
MGAKAYRRIYWYVLRYASVNKPYPSTLCVYLDGRENGGESG